MAIEDLIYKAQNLPGKPGCYIMKRLLGGKEQVLYIGKAKNLKKRVSSYFKKNQKNLKTEILVKHITDFDFISTENETEALVLENNLIKKYSPRYNIKLKDDKSYPYIIVDLSEPFPRLVYTRKIPKKKNLKIYGPFVAGSKISDILKILIKSFKLRDCSLREFKSRKEPCLLYQMNQCSASCVGLIEASAYESDLEQALSILEGKEKKSIGFLRKEMLNYADNENFEMAAIARDNISSLEEFCQLGKQKNVELKNKQENIDIIAYHKGEEEIEISIYMVRSGLLLGHKNLNFYLKEIKQIFEEEFVSYIYRYYQQTLGEFPDLIVIDLLDESLSLLSGGLSNLKRSKIEVRRPGRKFLSLYQLTKSHALEHQKSRLKSFGSSYKGLLKLAELLKLKERPMVLECYDIAVFAGSSPTASQIVFHDGLADKKSYRHYKLKELPEGNNDFAMMKEVLSRRIPHGNLPDVFIVDGGIQQVNVFLEVLKEFELSIPVVGIAKAKTLSQEEGFKERSIVKSKERLIIPGRQNPYILIKNMALYQIVTSMRDEAHRFSRRLHHKLESKRVISSEIDGIKGLGSDLRKKIMKRITQPLKEVARLSVEEISLKLEIAPRYAKLIKDYFSLK